MFFIPMLLSFAYFKCCSGNVYLKSYHEQNGEIEKFLSYAISKYSSEKNGFIIININHQFQDYTEFLTKNVFQHDAAVTVYDMRKLLFEWPRIRDRNVAIVIFDPTRSITNINNEQLQKIKPSRGKVIIIFTNIPPDLSLNQALLGKFAQLYNLNVIFVYKKSSELKVVTYNPFLPENETIVDLTTIKYNTDLYYNKLTDLHGLQINGLHTTMDRTKVRVKFDDDAQMRFSGKDYEVFKTIFERVNGNINILMVHDLLKHTESNPFALSNTSPNKSSIKRRIVEEGDVAFLVHSQSLLEDDDIFENTYPHTQDDVVVFLAKASEIPWSTSIMHIYDPEAITFFICVHLAAVILVVTIKKLRRKPQRLSVILDIARHMILCSFSRRIKFPVERLVMLGLISFSFIMNTTIQGRMTSIMTKKNYQKDIDTIEELGKSGLIIYGYEMTLNEVRKIYEGTADEMLKHMKPLPPTAISFDEFSDLAYEADASQIPKGGFGVLTNFDRAAFVTRVRKFRTNGRPMFHLMRESLIPSFQSFKVRYGSLFLGLVEKSLRRLQEGGFLKLWADRTLYEATIEGLLFPFEDYDDSDHRAQSIDMEKIRGCFVILIWGSIVSIVVFLFEIGCYLCAKRCN